MLVLGPSLAKEQQRGEEHGETADKRPGPDWGAFMKEVDG